MSSPSQSASDDFEMDQDEYTNSFQNKMSRDLQKALAKIKILKLQLIQQVENCVKEFTNFTKDYEYALSGDANYTSDDKQ